MNPKYDRDQRIVLYLAAAVIFVNMLSHQLYPANASGNYRIGRSLWSVPITGVQRLVKTFIAPQSQWGPGHRGIDYLTTEGAAILSPSDGTLRFSGSVATKPVITVQSGPYRASLEPVCASQGKGQAVEAGQVIGSVCGAGYRSHCEPQLCVHFSVRNASGYLSPQLLLGQLAPSVLAG
jgi:murein DD-endopeptidase MepM/ murein hydrolase activator NlpD